MKLIISGIFVHLILLGAIFDIYFKSPIINGMEPLKSKKSPPANRLFLIVADGLRAESLFGNNLTNLEDMEALAPYLRSKIISSKAAWGISHTRVPTESRPGHVALAAGIYEDPSAVAKGWKENPVEFDSVFNESFRTWAWGSPDIVPMFKKSTNVKGYWYSPDQQEFSGKTSTILLDDWVFHNFTKLFNVRYDDEEYKFMNSKQIIFFLHLLGLDTAGHTHKPGSQQHIKNIQHVDSEIRRSEDLIEHFYVDNYSTYIFTADHGMTDWGSHGAGSAHETETPFIAWGAGIRANKEPIHLNQADIAPLISTLIGIPIPVNSVGVLPIEILNMTKIDLAHAIFTNAKQIYAQYEEKRRRTEINSLSFLYKPFPLLTKQEFENIISVIKLSLENNDYDYVIKSSGSMIQAALDGLDYYQNYYQRMLLTCIASTYVGWIVFLLIYLTELPKDNFFIKRETVSPFLMNFVRCTEFYMRWIFVLAIIITWCLLFVQSLPAVYYVYCTLPLYIWWCNIGKSVEWVPRVLNLFTSLRNVLLLFGGIILYLIGVESLVLCFFHRETLSLTLIMLAFWPYFFCRVHYNVKLAWAVSCFSLAIFPFMPVVGRNFNLYFIAITAVLWIFTSFGSLFINLFWVAKKEYFFIDHKQLYMTITQSFFLAIAVFNLYSVDHSMKNEHGLAWYNQCCSWVTSGISLYVGIMGPSMIIARLFNIAMALLVPFMLLSVSYEPLFLLILFINLILWLCIEHEAYGQFFRNLALIPFHKIRRRRTLTIKRNHIDTEDFRRGFFIVFYVILAFFGMGNIASLNSFDPMWVRNYVVVFDPFVMGALILLKNIIPFLIVTCVFRAVTVCLNAPVKKIFFIVLVFCDIMGLHFLFLVKNTGSWLEIGTSISHYIIVQAIVLFLLLLYVIAIPITTYNFSPETDNIPIYPYKVHRR